MPDSSAERPVAGLAAALSGIGTTLVALLRTRLELATIEFEEERERIKLSLVLIVVAAGFGCFTLVALSVLVVVLLWDLYPLAALSGLVVVYGVIATGALVALRRLLARRPFAATLSELERDAEVLKPKP